MVPTPYDIDLYANFMLIHQLLPAIVEYVTAIVEYVTWCQKRAELLIIFEYKYVNNE